MPTEQNPEGTNMQADPMQTSGMRMSGMQVTPRGRFWAVHDRHGQLVCVTVYKKGATEVVRRLSLIPRNKAQNSRLPCKASAPARRAAASTRKRLPRSRHVPTGNSIERASAKKG